MATDLRITDRPWNGQCATTGLTMAEFAAFLDGLDDVPDWVTRGAISVTRSYGTVLGNESPLREIIDMIEHYRHGDVTDECPADYLALYEFPPQWPNEEPWVRKVAAAICSRYGIRGLCDPGYIANVIHGEEIDADHPGQRHSRRSPWS